MQVHGKAETFGGGSLLTVLVNLQTEDIFKTSILVAVEALFRFFMSLAMKWVVKKIKKKSRS